MMQGKKGVHRNAPVINALSFKRLLQQALESAWQMGGSHGIQVHVDSSKLNIDWSEAIGFIDRVQTSSRLALTVDHPLKIASNTKTFVAAAILRLWEEARLDLDHSIEIYISKDHAECIANAGYEIASITTRHLLTHTSGLFDYADSPQFVEAFHQQPQHQWTRSEQLLLAMTTGQAYGNPGEVFRYSDTGYILLGEIIERVHGDCLGAALRTLLDYEGLGLHSTWLEGVESAPLEHLPLVHQYDGDLDSNDLNNACDIYGGGGLVSTVEDLPRFMRGLFSGKIFKDPNTLKTMLTTVQAERGGPDSYGMFAQIPGEYRLGIDGGASGKVFFHKGYLGTYAAYVPSHDLVISLSVNVHGGVVREHLIKAILDIFSIVQ